VGEESLAVQKRYLGIRSKVRNGRKGEKTSALGGRSQAITAQREADIDRRRKDWHFVLRAGFSEKKTEGRRPKSVERRR
jgi:hypothetical protein